MLDYEANDFNLYQEWTRSTAIYPADSALEYTVLGLVSEAGEIAGKVKKVIRDGDGLSGAVTADQQEELAAELGDVLWYLARVADEVDLNLGYVAGMNRAKLESRKNRGVLGGSGDNR